MKSPSTQEKRILDEGALFGALEDETTRKILAYTAEEARSAKDLDEQINVTQTTIYRRLEQLSEDGLVEDSLELDESGNHYKTYQSTISHVEVDIESDGITASVEWREEISERFTRIWEQIRGDR